LSVAALALVLTAAAAHAAWNLFAKRAGGGATFVWLCAASGSVLWAPIAVTAVVLSPPALGAEALLWLSVTAVLHTAYYVALQGSYRRGDLSVVYPVARGTGALLAVVGAVVALGERPTILSLVGAVLIASGILGLSGSGGSLHPRLATILPALGTGALISVYTVWDAFVVTELAVPALMLVWVADLGRGIVLAPLARHRAADVARIWRTHRREVLGVAILSPLAYVLVLLALRFAPLTYVAPTREVSILIGVVIGRRLLGEADVARRLAATTAVIVGTIVATIG
jgi:drug/metabolite transporter (DMT)-like permease